MVKNPDRGINSIHETLIQSIGAEIRERFNTVDPEFLNRCINEVIKDQLPEFRTELYVRVRRLIESEQKRIAGQVKEKELKKIETIERFSLNWRIQHIVLLSCCVILIATGIPLKFHDQSWAIFFLKLLGGIKSAGILHRIGAVGLIGVGLYHLMYLALTRNGRWNFMQLLPGPKDLRDLFIQIQYYLGKSEKHARFGRFSYIEKFDYWAVYWGMVVMVGSGIILWFETNFPLTFYHIAREAHSDEALLATLAIIIWHFYNVHLNPDKFPMNRVWLNGRLTKEEMIKEHPLEYEEYIKKKIEKANDERKTSEDSD